jgi:hypothetical protein
MLLLKLDISVSGCQRKMYITSAQLRLANTGQALASILARDSGVIKEERGCIFGWTESLARASTTRAKTYMTICTGTLVSNLPFANFELISPAG